MNSVATSLALDGRRVGVRYWHNSNTCDYIRL